LEIIDFVNKQELQQKLCISNTWNGWSTSDFYKVVVEILTAKNLGLRYSWHVVAPMLILKTRPIPRPVLDFWQLQDLSWHETCWDFWPKHVESRLSVQVSRLFKLSWRTGFNYYITQSKKIECCRLIDSLTQKIYFSGKTLLKPLTSLKQ